MAAIVKSNKMMAKLTSSLSSEQLNTLVRNEMLSQISAGDTGGLVFICGEEEISYPSEILSQVSPLIATLVPESKDCCDLYRKKDSKIFISLDDVRADTIKKLMDIVFNNSSYAKFSPTISADVVEAAKMFGAEYLLPQSNAYETEDHVSEDEIEERMMQDVTEESLNLEEASEYESDVSIMKLSGDFFNSILNEIIAEDALQFIEEEVEMKKLRKGKEVDIKDDSQSSYIKGSLTWNDVVEKPVTSFYSVPKSSYSSTKEVDNDETELDSNLRDKDDIEEDMFVDIQRHSSDGVDQVEDELLNDGHVDESTLEGSTVTQENEVIKDFIGEESFDEEHDESIEVRV